MVRASEKKRPRVNESPVAAGGNEIAMSSSLLVQALTCQPGQAQPVISFPH